MSVFAKIIRGELPSKKVFENERILAIEDIRPIAPVHILIFPKKEIENLEAAGPEDFALIQELLQVAQQIAREKGIEKGYRLLTNNGREAGQEVFHLHFHLIGGRKLGALG